MLFLSWAAFLRRDVPGGRIPTQMNRLGSGRVGAWPQVRTAHAVTGAPLIRQPPPSGIRPKPLGTRASTSGSNRPTKHNGKIERYQRILA